MRFCYNILCYIIQLVLTVVKLLGKADAPFQPIEIGILGYITVFTKGPSTTTRFNVLIEIIVSRTQFSRVKTIVTYPPEYLLQLPNLLTIEQLVAIRVQLGELPLQDVGIRERWLAEKALSLVPEHPHQVGVELRPIGVAASPVGC